MKKISALLSVLALFASVAAVRANLNFQLGVKHESAEAPDPENKFITDGESRIYLRVPVGWKATSTPDNLALLPEQPSSEVQISQVRGAQTLPLDPGGLEALRKKALASLPDGAKDIKPVGENSDLLPVFGWKSFEVVFEYDFFGQRVRRSILYINMIPGRVVQVGVSALPADFEKVHEKVRKLMFGWFEPSRDLTPEQARQYENGEFKGG